jgi:hypothetical protein
MPDLDAQIRAKLAEIRHNAQKRGIDADEEHDERLWRLSGDVELLANTLLAVLDEHACHKVDDPCPDVRAITRGLGIEASGD